jgi:hypothetical protein
MRRRLFGAAQVSYPTLMFIDDYLNDLSKTGENRFVFLRSQNRDRTRGIPLLTEEDKQTFLTNKLWQYGKRFQTKEQPAEPLRTVTVNFEDPTGDNGLVLVSSVGHGDFITDTLMESMAFNLWGPSTSNQLKNASVNDSTLDTVAKLGLVPGIVGPFINEAYVPKVRKIFYVRDPDKGPNEPVEIALSPFDSLVLRKVDFEKMLLAYGKKHLYRTLTVL